jgi:hypothetical protein
MVALPVDPAKQLEATKTLLLQAEQDIAEGCKVAQQQLLAGLQVAGRGESGAAR